MRVLPLLVLLTASPALAQVEVSTGALKPSYLRGEPIVVSVEVKNVGTDLIAYSYCDARVTFEVNDAARRVRPNLMGCFSGVTLGSGGGCFESDLPQLLAGERTSFTYLLTGYDLPPGRYHARIVGRAGVSWGQGFMAQLPDAPPIRVSHQPSEPVPGAFFDRAFAFEIRPASEHALQGALAPYLTNAVSDDLDRRTAARSALAESAPSFLTTVIAQFVDDPALEFLAVDALGRINTAESRSQLKALFGDATHPQRRQAVIAALADDGNAEDLTFLASVAHDDSVTDEARMSAILGLGRIGGDRAARALGTLLSDTKTEELRWAIIALGNTRSREAVALLIEEPLDLYGSGLCEALVTLTHRQWCGGDLSTIREHWHEWWRENRSVTPIYGNDACPAEGSISPIGNP